MSMAELREQLSSAGYTIAPGVLDFKQVAWLRSFLRPRFDLPLDQRPPSDTPRDLVDVYHRFPEMRWLLFHQPTLDILRFLLGPDFVVLRESAGHLNQFGGWHKDTSSQETAG